MLDQFFRFPTIEQKQKLRSENLSPLFTMHCLYYVRLRLTFVHETNETTVVPDQHSQYYSTRHK
jgi:hypothetical protein